MQIGLFYGSSTCYSEMAAEKIQAQIDAHFRQSSVDIFNIKDEPLVGIQSYQHIILGIPTWDFGQIQEDWETAWEELDLIDFSNKQVALYGLGDQVGYPEWFLDAMGYLHDQVKAKGATIVGHWPITGYEFEDSKALTEDNKYFVGLALDEDNQFELSDERIKRWCDLVCEQFRE